ncbi:MAG: SpoIIE family protein phosphatase [Bryobacteraceae bacterium]
MKAQLELRERALAATAEGVVIADARLPDNPIIYANAGFERLTGYSVEDVLGRNCRFLQGPNTDWDSLERLRSAIRQKQECTIQLLNYRKDGSTFWNRLSVTPIRDAAGEVTHYIGVQSDITEQKRTEEALQAANQKLEAVAGRLNQDLEAAAALQRALLPEALPQVPGVNLAWAFRPCQELAGDTLNVFLLDDRRLALYILDVSGHGVASSLLSFTLSHLLSPIREKSALYQAAGDGSGAYHVLPPADVVARLNKQFPFNPDLPQYFTIAYGILELETARLRYVSAGHFNPVYVPAGEPSQIAGAGSSPPVGLFPNPRYEEQVLELKPGDRVYLSTDGVIEAENSAGKEFGLARLVDALDRCRNSSLAEGLTSAMASAQQWCAPSAFADDVSMLALEISNTAG